MAIVGSITIIDYVGIYGSKAAKGFSAFNISLIKYLRFHDLFQSPISMKGHFISAYISLNMNYNPGPVFCLLLGASSVCAWPITGQVTSVNWSVFGWAWSELTPSKRQNMGPGGCQGTGIEKLSLNVWLKTAILYGNMVLPSLHLSKHDSHDYKIGNIFKWHLIQYWDASTIIGHTL